MGKSIGNFVVKVPEDQKEDFYDKLKATVSDILKDAPVDNPSEDRNYFISKPMNLSQWVPIFPALEIVGSKNLSKLISIEFKTITIYCSVFDSDDIQIKFYKDGNPVLEYKYITQEANMKSPEWVGDVSLLLNLFSIDESKKQEFEVLLKGEKQEYDNEVFYSVDADSYYSQMLNFLGLASLSLLNDYGYRYLEHDDTYEELVDSGILTPTEKILLE